MDHIKKIHQDDTTRAAVAACVRAAASKGKDPMTVVCGRYTEEFSRSSLAGKHMETGEDPKALFDAIREAYANEDDLRVIAVKDIGVFVTGETKQDADHALECLSKGIEYVPSPEKCCRPAGRLSGKVAVVTGSAQGFGEGIADEMVSEGAYMIVADLNFELASQVAGSFNDKYGIGTALAIETNVADEDSVRKMTERTVLEYGGIDIFVNNAGVLRAGAIEDMTVANFKFVTDINYMAYFICVKYASRPMKIKAYTDPGSWSDIIQINSKSGLEGSNKNFAYAGSKFGGIGLTQSFALELVEHNIKVNSICPGNYYDGPLWSDPEKGLFVAYLKAGKVPGAKTVEDVRQFYLSKSPIRRGCDPKDVSKAIFYCTEQMYETGQAIPVTGGQSMLK